jgi:DNA-directed RNA polymerase subunit L/DNA-directed RNA polymerase alpha subunit
MMQFQNLHEVDSRTLAFTLTPTHVTYANTLRRLILTGVETIAFRADMTSTGSTTDVFVKRNDTPMTNEMLADRIGLLPIHVTNPLAWNPDKYIFKLHVTSDKDNMKYVKAGDFKVVEKMPMAGGANSSSNANDDEEVKEGDKEAKNAAVQEGEKAVPTEMFFPPNPITGDTCLIATLQPGSGQTEQIIELAGKATKGTGREHARFSPVSQCSYEYTQDDDEVRIEEMFTNWLRVAKKVSADMEKDSDRYLALRREFNTMQIKRCYKRNDKGEPDSFNFTVETAGVLPVRYIVERACEVGENMCSRYVNMAKGELPKEITISPADARVVGYDFLIRGHDHTLGNLLQTWLVENHIEGAAEPKITYAGYKVPHPLRDEMVLRIGVEDGNEETARLAFAEAAKGCVDMFQKMRNAWRSVTGAAPIASAAASKPAAAKSAKPSFRIPRG